MIHAAGGRTGDLADRRKDLVCEEQGESDIGLAFPGMHQNHVVENPVQVSPDLSLLCRGHRQRF